MQLDIRGRRLALTPAMVDHVARRIRFALGRFDGRVRRVTARIGDVNGPRGGIDKRCRLHVDLGGRPVTIDELDADLYAAVDRAAERAGRAVQRTLARLRAA